MSLPVVVTPSAGQPWATAWQQVEGLRKGRLPLSLTNYDNNSVPQIASGSWVEHASAVHKCTSNDTITGTPTANQINYITLVPSGTGASAILTPTWSTTAPTWSDTYQGWFVWPARYAGGCYYDGTNYPHKFLFDKGRDKNREFELEIGDWDMDADSGHNVAHGLDVNKIRGISVIIRNDAKTICYPISPTYHLFVNDADTSDQDAIVAEINATDIVLRRRGSALFDTTDFDDVGGAQETRGWVTIKWAVI